MFLREVLSLGSRSIGPAISALILLCFYRFGMGLYLEFAVQQTSPLGFPDERARAAYLILTASAYLPLLALVYTPFLPLQDAILRGGRKSFLNSVRQVLECMVPFGFSSIIQVVILATPVFLMFVLAALALSSVPEAPKEVIAGTVVLLIVPACIWVAIAGLFLVFATPALVLDGLGPARSIRFSVAEVARRFWGVIGRLIVGFAMVVFGVVLASFPASMLAMAAAVSGSDLPALKVARVLWTSVVTALAFPFSVAVLMTLYRAVAPAPAVGGVTDAGGGDGGGGAGGEGGEPPRPLPENPPPVAEPHKAETPYVFE
jgi:hypothetical protein